MKTRTFLYLLGSYLLAGERLHAQQVPWDSTFRTERYYVEIEQHKAYPSRPGDIVFLGNSITYYINWNELLDNPAVKNRGISGDNTFGILERLEGIIGTRPAKIFIMIGINDLARNVPDSILVRNYERMILRLKSGTPSTLIYLQSLLPVNTGLKKAADHYDRIPNIIYVNNAMRELALKHEVTFIDLYPHFTNGDHQLKKEYTYDGIHLSIEGYRKWAAILKQGRYLDRTGKKRGKGFGDE